MWIKKHSFENEDNEMLEQITLEKMDYFISVFLDIG